MGAARATGAAVSEYAVIWSSLAAMASTGACAVSASISGWAIISACAPASSAATGATSGAIVDARARRWARACGVGGGGGAWTAFVTASKRGQEENIRRLLLWAPARARRGLPRAAWGD